MKRLTILKAGYFSHKPIETPAAQSPANTGKRYFTTGIVYLGFLK
jgi:hypothetical protein